MLVIRMEFACQGRKLPALQRVKDFPYGWYWCAHFPELLNFFSSLKTWFCSGETTKGDQRFSPPCLLLGFEDALHGVRVELERKALAQLLWLLLLLHDAAADLADTPAAEATLF